LSQSDEGKKLLKLDFANAFNSVRRDHAAICVSKFAPQFLPFYSACYNSTSYLSIGDTVIKSDEGLQQGDPLAPFLFCLSIHELLSNLGSEMKIAYLDDISLYGTDQQLLDDVKMIGNSFQQSFFS